MAALKGPGFQLSVDNAPVTRERLPATTLEGDSSDGDGVVKRIGLSPILSKQVGFPRALG